MKERDDGLNMYLIVDFPQSNKCQNKRMLHLNFIDEYILTSGIDIGVKEQGSGDGAEEKHVEKDEEDKEELEPLGYFEG
jgi:hypothetical protein